MASYYFNVRIIGRSRALSALKAAAYRSASRLHDSRQDLDFNHSNKPNVIHSEVLAPENAPKQLLNRELLWNAVEAREKQRNAQLARDVEFALPEELLKSEAIALAIEFVRSEFVERGMIADLNIHWDRGNPHAHVMLTMRELSVDGFGLKATRWNKLQLLLEWREHWADLANEHLLRAGVDARIDHRSYRNQGIELEPTRRLSYVVLWKRARGERPERWVEFEEIRERNVRRIELHPEIVFDRLTRRQSTFTLKDMAREVACYVDGGEHFEDLITGLKQSPELVLLTAPTLLGKEILEPARYTTQAMVRLEQRIADVAREMAFTLRHPVSKAAIEAAVGEAPGLTDQQREAVRQVIIPCGIAVLAECRGAETSAVLATANAAWEASGYQVHGAAPSSLSAQKLMKESGIETRTLTAWELAWKNPEHSVSNREIFIINQAGMVGSRQLARVISKLHEAGAKAVLIGDVEQFRPIEAGAALRAIAERTGYHELIGIGSKQPSWQREASRGLAHGHVTEALDRYRRRGALHFAQTRREAIDELLKDWSDYHLAQGTRKTSIILAPWRADAHELNRRARHALSERGELVNEVVVKVWREVNPRYGFAHIEGAAQRFAIGERVMFLKKDRELDLKSEMLGTITKLSKDSISVALDGSGHEVTFDPHSYAALEYGYATSVVKARSATFDRVFLLVTHAMDSQLMKLALNCHRELATLYAGHDDFAGFAALIERLSRPLFREPRLEYAARRGLDWTIDDHAKPQNLTQPSRPTRLQNEPHSSVGLRITRPELMNGFRAGEPDVKLGAAELCPRMSQSAWEIEAERLRPSEAGRAHSAREASDLARRIERKPARYRDRDFEMEP